MVSRRCPMSRLASSPSLTTTAPHTQSMNLDKPLDDIIGEKRKSRAPRRSRPAGGARKPSTGNVNNNNNGAAAAAPAPAVSGSVHVGDKIIVSGLPTDVNEAQVRVSPPITAPPN